MVRQMFSSNTPMKFFDQLKDIRLPHSIGFSARKLELGGDLGLQEHVVGVEPAIGHSEP